MGSQTLALGATGVHMTITVAPPFLTSVPPTHSIVLLPLFFLLPSESLPLPIPTPPPLAHPVTGTVVQRELLLQRALIGGGGNLAASEGLLISLAHPAWPRHLHMEPHHSRAAQIAQGAGETGRPAHTARLLSSPCPGEPEKGAEEEADWEGGK